MIFASSALEYAARGWTTMPLVRDKNGFPKRPITDKWQRLELDDVGRLAWDHAAGIGVVLGRASGNLAVIDLDDPQLAARVATLTDGRYYYVQTARQRGHLYVYEEAPSASRAFTIRWDGRPIQIELKAQGTQVAAPPSPGYAVVHDGPVIHARDIGAVWLDLAQTLGIQPGAAVSGGGYPAPWQRAVSKDERNKSAYIEAHWLHSARAPVEFALEFMHWRWERDYEPGDQDWTEIARTIASAYGKSEQWQGAI